MPEDKSGPAERALRKWYEAKVQVLADALLECLKAAKKNKSLVAEEECLNVFGQELEELGGLYDRALKAIEKHEKLNKKWF